MRIILLGSAMFSSEGVSLGLFLNWPNGRVKAGATPKLVGGRTSGGDAKRRHLAAAGGDVGEAGGAKAREKPTKFSAEQVRRKVYQHVAVIYSARLRDVRENFAANGNAFLHEPRTILCGKRALDGFVPDRLARFPSERCPGAAVLIARLKHQ